jgi:hypothetical protein
MTTHAERYTSTPILQSQAALLPQGASSGAKVVRMREGSDYRSQLREYRRTQDLHR